MFERSWVQIPALYTGWTFICIDLLLKLHCLPEKTKNKRKMAGVGHFKKNNEASPGTIPRKGKGIV